MITQSALGNGTITLASVLPQENETIVTENEDVKEMEQNRPLTENEGEPVIEPEAQEPFLLMLQRIFCQKIQLLQQESISGPVTGKMHQQEKVLRNRLRYKTQ